MDKALSEVGRTIQQAKAKPIDWRSRMSDHIAYALLVYTGLHIWVTMGAIKTSGGSILPYFALVVLVVAIVPACRAFERRWEGLSDDQPGDRDLEGPFKRDCLLLWLMAIGLPFVLTGMFKAVLLLA